MAASHGHTAYALAANLFEQVIQSTAARPTLMRVYNLPKQGSKCSDADVQSMVTASNILIKQVAAAWGLAVPQVVFSKPTEPKDPADWLFSLVGEDNDVPGALAYHTEQGDVVDGFILTKTILDNGGTTLLGKGKQPTIASALFHELAEAFVDPTVNVWWQDDKGVYYAAEICDPVQDNIVPINIAAAGHPASLVGLSDFVFPTWRDTQYGQAAKGTPLNYLNTLKHPFTLDKGGYYVKFDPSSDKEPQSVFGREVPDWIKTLKTTRGRQVYRRTHQSRPGGNPHHH